jgi:hypothetical protein
MDKKISQLKELVSPQDNDLLAIVNSGETKKIKLENLLNESSVYSCSADVNVNDLVYFHNSILKKSSSDDVDTCPPVGFVRAKITSTTCQIQREGKRTGFSGLETGKRYYLGLNGGITPIPPESDNNVRIHIGIASSPSTL